MNLKKTLQALALAVCVLCSTGAMAQEAYAVYSHLDLKLTFRYDDQRSSFSETTFDLNTGSDSPAWLDAGIYDDVTLVEFDPSFTDARPTTTYAWFIYMSGLRDIKGLKYLNTTDVANMSYMFYGCEKLKEIDVRAFNTANVTTMYGMFYGCSSLSGLDLDNFNTANVTNMGGMFRNCSSLKGLDLSSFDTRKVTKMSYMFYQCENLMTIFVGDGWNTDAVTVSNSMFEGCTSLAGIQGTAYDAGHTDMEFAHLDQGSGNPGYLSYPNDESPVAYVVNSSSDNTLTFYYDNRSIFRPGTIYELNTGTEDPAWINDDHVERVVFDPSFAGARPTTTYKWFYKLYSLLSVTGLDYLNTADVTNMSKMFYSTWRVENLDVSHFNTANVTDMSSMFYDCENLKALDLSHFNTANVTDMNHMFYFCTGLENLDLGGFNTEKVTDMSYMFADCQRVDCFDLNSFNTSNVTNMSHMFDACRYTSSIDVSHLNTANVTDMSAMFNDCFNLTSLDVSSFNTAKVTTMNSMFDDCLVLTSLDLSSFNTAKVTDMTNMFCYCKALENLNVTSFNTANVTNMDNMFAYCRSLPSIDVSSFNTYNVTSFMFMFNDCSALTTLDLSNFNTENATRMFAMFSSCSALTSLDLSSFTTPNLNDADRIFEGCVNLTTIYAGADWDFPTHYQYSNMFMGCESLVGGMGTTYDPDHTGKEYARIDGGEARPGYFTEKPASLRGDVNGDGSVNVSDATSLIGILLNEGVAPACADMNGDGIVNVSDATELINYLLSIHR